MVNNKKSIALDMDDVLNPLIPSWILEYNRDYNDNLQPSDITSWDVCNFVKPECNEKIYNYLFKPKFFTYMKPQEDSIEVTKWLIEHFNVHVVTNSHYKTWQDKIEWVIKYYPHLQADKGKFICTSEKHMWRADYLVDDNGVNIESFAPYGKVILYDKPHNQYLGDKYTRLHNWKEIKTYFENELLEQ